MKNGLAVQVGFDLSSLCHIKEAEKLSFQYSVYGMGLFLHLCKYYVSGVVRALQQCNGKPEAKNCLSIMHD